MTVYCKIDGKLTKWLVNTVCHRTAIRTLEAANEAMLLQSPAMCVGPVLVLIEGSAGA